MGFQHQLHVEQLLREAWAKGILRHMGGSEHSIDCVRGPFLYLWQTDTQLGHET
jgi:hypothetical protein